MSDFEADILFDLAHNAQAWRTLQDPTAAGGLDAEGVLHLCRAAGYSEEECQKAARKRAEQRLDANQAPVSTTYVHQ